MGDNKISEAVEAFIGEVASKLDDAGRCLGDYERFRSDVRDAVISALPHLQGEAVPVGYRWRHSAGEKWQYSDIPCGWENEPLFAHPQPAELNEVSGNSGELGDQKEFISDIYIVAGTPGMTPVDLADWIRDVLLRNIYALAATGKQQDAKLCINCNGSGEGREILGYGPDDYYEVDATCSVCDGTGKQQVGEKKHVRLPKADLDRINDISARDAEQAGDAQGSREQFEAWAKAILGDNPNWRESGEGELARQAWQAALASHQPVGDEDRAEIFRKGWEAGKAAQGVDLGRALDIMWNWQEQLGGHVYDARDVARTLTSSDMQSIGVDAVACIDASNRNEAIVLAKREILRALIDGRDAGTGVGNIQPPRDLRTKLGETADGFELVNLDEYAVLPLVPTEDMLDIGWPLGEIHNGRFDREGAYADLIATQVPMGGK